MASIDDDFSLLADDNSAVANPSYHHQQTFAGHRYKPQQIQHPLLVSSASLKNISGEENDNEGDGYRDNNTPSYNIGANPYENDSNPFENNDIQTDREDISDSGTPYNNYKRPKISSGVSGEYRKDREEWSDTAIACLLEAYMEKFVQLNRGNLRGRDWEQVAAMVSERCEKQSKSVEQCKNKVDNLKKRYKLESHRMSNEGIAMSHWPWFKQMEQIVGNSVSVKGRTTSEEDKGIVAMSSSGSGRQSKRYCL